MTQSIRPITSLILPMLCLSQIPPLPIYQSSLLLNLIGNQCFSPLEELILLNCSLLKSRNRKEEVLLAPIPLILLL